MVKYEMLYNKRIKLIFLIASIEFNVGVREKRKKKKTIGAKSSFKTPHSPLHVEKKRCITSNIVVEVGVFSPDGGLDAAQKAQNHFTFLRFMLN
jgi:hypothetical protein